MAGLASKLGSLLPGSKPTNLLAVAVNHSKVGLVINSKKVKQDIFDCLYLQLERYKDEIRGRRG